MALAVRFDHLRVPIVLRGGLIWIILGLWLSIFLLNLDISIVWCDRLISCVSLGDVVVWIIISVERYVIARLWSPPLIRSTVNVALRLVI